MLAVALCFLGNLLSVRQEGSRKGVRLKMASDGKAQVHVSQLQKG